MLLSEAMIESLAESLLALDPGPLAELRRMEPDGAGVPIFWRLAAQCDLNLPAERATAWMQFVKILAILTPAGQRDSTMRLHEQSRRLGTVFCDGGDPAWPRDSHEPQPFVSEARLARLLAIPAAQRGKAFERLARMLARSHNSQSGVHCGDLAELLLNTENTAPVRTLAQTYYQRLDRATRNTSEKGIIE